MKTCPECSAEAYDEEAICRQCGSKLSKAEAATSAPSTTDVEAAVIVPRKTPLSNTTRFMIGLAGFVVILIAVYALSYRSSPRTDSTLPKHEVVSDSQIVNGRLIEIHVDRSDLSRVDCMALVTAYRDRAQSTGQVSIYQADQQGVLKIWCVDNLDGQGIVFNDALLTPTQPEATTRAPVIIYSTIPALPPHTVAKNTTILNGRRIEIHVTDPNLTKEQCIALLNAYLSQAQPNGQVSVRKPDSYGGLSPWCVNNLDEYGTFFNDELFK